MLNYLNELHESNIILLNYFSIVGKYGLIYMNIVNKPLNTHESTINKQKTGTED